ncbi:MAG: RsmD family RNA methyltransferase [Acidocella sp.]|nr:RsmD family RNA methyltransferase [Acidocella sp.]
MTAGAPGPRVIAGAWRGRRLVAPTGAQTRPTSIRARQAVFDILMHAPWGGGDLLRGARVLDVFAGTGAYGLEALSRGAASADFIEMSKPALAALRANITACGATALSMVEARDVLRVGPGVAHGLVFLDPPYGQGLVGRALDVLSARGWIAPEAVMVAELGPEDEFEVADPLAVRRHGKARLMFWRFTP